MDDESQVVKMIPIDDESKCPSEKYQTPIRWKPIYLQLRKHNPQNRYISDTDITICITFIGALERYTKIIEYSLWSQ
jgi:hypothetical protein